MEQILRAPKMGTIPFTYLLILEPKMANIASAIKRDRQNVKRRAYNRHFRSSMRTEIKKLWSAIESGDGDTAKALLPNTVAIIQRVAQKGIIHRKNAARRVSRLSKAVNSLG
jgi:small subunit ribosomal protein S20